MSYTVARLERPQLCSSSSLFDKSLNSLANIQRSLKLVFFALGAALVTLFTLDVGFNPRSEVGISILGHVITWPSSFYSAFSSASDSPTTQSTTSTSATSMSVPKRNVGYFTNWGIYGRKFPPSSIPAQDLTHVLYAFANLSPETGVVTLTDSWSDQEIHYPGDSWDGPQQGVLFGNLKQLNILKRQHRHLKVLLSIGGWTYSSSFHPVVVSHRHRQEFVRSAVKIVEDFGFDGLDVDYEYPGDEAQAEGYVHLLRELREGLNELWGRIGNAGDEGQSGRFSLTIAAPCGKANYEKLKIREMDRYLDFWNLMAYDYSGSWDSIANHQANVYVPPGAPASVAQSTDAAVRHYVETGGVHPSRLVIGIPLYGRSFLSTQGPGSPFSGVGQGSWEAGSYDYRALPLPGATVYQDHKAIAAWSYDPQKGEMISYDDEPTALAKAAWIVDSGLGGAMYWELSGDKDLGTRQDMEKGHGKDEVPGRSLVRLIAGHFAYAPGGLDRSWNHLGYPTSKFENLRNGQL